MNYWPVGTGPYMLTEYQENRRHVLSRNPNFRGEPYPCEGEAGGQGRRPARRLRQADALHRPGRVLDREGEASRTRPSSCRATTTTRSLALRLAPGPGLRRQELREGRAALPRARHPDAEDARDLQLVPRLQLVGPGRRQGQDARGAGAQPQAAPGAVDRDRLGRVRSRVREQGGGRAGDERRAARRLCAIGRSAINRTVYDVVDGKPRRKSDRGGEAAAGRGRLPRRARCEDRPAAGAQLRLPARADAGAQGEVDWMVKQFAKIGVQLELRATDYNRFQDKADKGSLQIFWWGWFADYPDAENFLFLLYGPNSQAPPRATATTRPTTRTPSSTSCSRRCVTSTTSRASSRSSTR